MHASLWLIVITQLLAVIAMMSHFFKTQHLTTLFSALIVSGCLGYNFGQLLAAYN